MFATEQVNTFVVRYEELVAGGMPIIDAFKAIESENGNDAMWVMVDELFRRGMEEGCKDTRTILMGGPKLLEWKELWQAMEIQFCGRELESNEWGANPDGPNNWTPTTDHMWDEQLGAVPPRKMAANCFLVGESWHSTKIGEPIYACFACINGRYYARYMTLKMFNSEVQRDTLPKAA